MSVTLLPRFQQFIKERQYVLNVSPATLFRYRYALCWLETETPTANDLKAAIVRMRDHGLRVVSVNSHLACIASYLHWASPSGQEKCGVGCRHLRVPKLKAEEREPEMFSEAQVKALLSWKPKTPGEHRLATMIAFLFDTGARSDEMLSIKWEDVDFDNLLVLLHGKGRKDRRVPVSLELRKRLFLWKKKQAEDEQLKMRQENLLVFGSRGGTKQGRRNVLRDVKGLCRKLGFEPPARTVHSCRHTTATNFINRGASPFHLMKLLGHTTTKMSARYCHLSTADLQKVHAQVSLLA